jgi:uncharacterized protein YqjF (DUF2071 family)
MAVSHPALQRVAHRPWPLPASQWVGRQSWRDLLFAHWPIEVAAIRHLVPAALTVQEFDGTSWIGLVPFRMAGVMVRPLPDLPWISAFPELNVRLYVEYEGKPGVWFISLDATNPLAVWAARRYFFLPYYRADISLEYQGDSIRYRSARRGRGPVLDISYRPASAPYESRPGTLEHFLTERYCLYAQARNRTLYRCEVHHHPWPLQRAEAEADANSYLSGPGVNTVSGPPAVLHFAKRLDVVVWNPVAVGA